MSDPSRDPIDLTTGVVGLYHTGDSELIPSSPGPPPRIDGFTVGAPVLNRNPPHGGEMHPDGDELLFLISGKVTVVLEDREPPREIELAPGQAVVVPRGVWHRVLLSEPSQLLHITPGPGGEHRPLSEGTV